MALSRYSICPSEYSRCSMSDRKERVSVKKQRFKVGDVVEYRCWTWAVGEVVYYDEKRNSVGIRTKRGSLVTRPARSVRLVREPDQQQQALMPSLAIA